MPKSKGSKSGPGQQKAKGKTTSSQEEEADTDNPVRASKRARRERVIFDPSPAERDTEGEVGETTEDMDNKGEPRNCQELFNAPMSANCADLHENITTTYPKLDMILKIKCSKSEVDCSKYKPVLTQVSTDVATDIGDTDDDSLCEDVPMLIPDLVEPSIATILPPARAIIQDLKLEVIKNKETSSTVTEKSAQESRVPSLVLDLPETGHEKLTSSSSPEEEGVISVSDQDHDESKIAGVNPKEISRPSKRNPTKTVDEVRQTFSKKSENPPIRMKFNVKSRSSSFSDDPPLKGSDSASENTASSSYEEHGAKANPPIRMKLSLKSGSSSISDDSSNNGVEDRDSSVMKPVSVNSDSLPPENTSDSNEKETFTPTPSPPKSLLLFSTMPLPPQPSECQKVELVTSSKTTEDKGPVADSVCTGTQVTEPEIIAPSIETLKDNTATINKDSKNECEIHAPLNSSENTVRHVSSVEEKPAANEDSSKTLAANQDSEAKLQLNPTNNSDNSRKNTEEPQNTCGRRPKRSASQTKSTESHNQKNSKSEKPEHGKFEKPEYSKSEKPEHGKSEKPEHGKSEKPEHGKLEKPEHGKSEKPEHGKSEKSDLGNFEKPEHEKFEKPEHGKSEKSDLENFDKPEHRKFEKPEHGKSDKQEDGKSEKQEHGKSDKQEHGKSDKQANPKQLREIHCSKCHAEVPTKIALQLHTCYSIMDQTIQTDGGTSRKRPETGLYNTKGRRKSTAADTPEKVSTESENLQSVSNLPTVKELNSSSTPSDTELRISNNESLSSPNIEPVVNTSQTVIQSTLHQEKDCAKKLKYTSPEIVIDAVNSDDTRSQEDTGSVVAVINDVGSNKEVPHVSDMFLTSPGAANNEQVQEQTTSELTVPPDLEDEFARISPNLQNSQSRREDLTLNVLPSALQFEEEDASSELTTPESFSDNEDLSSQVEDASEKEVQLFHKARQLELVDEIVDSDNNLENDTTSSQKKRRGRPKGSKNKAKEEAEVNKPSETIVESNCPVASESVSELGVENKEITAVIRVRGKQKGRGKGSLSSTPSSGSPNITPRSISPAEPSTEQIDVVKVEKIGPVKRKGVTTEKNKDVKTAAPGNVNDKELKRSNQVASKKDSNVSDKTGKKRKRIVKMSDSEDSSVSTDSPLKPKTYKNAFGSQLNSPQLSPCSSPKNVLKQSKSKKKALLNHEMSKMVAPVKVKEEDSPVEDLPLVPRSYHAQKKELDKVKNEELKKSVGGGKAKEQVEVKNLEDVKVKSDIDKEKEEIADRKELAKKIKSFKSIETNAYLCPRKINKQSKKMQCDCTPLSSEEIENGEKGCGSDCLNKMLYIECGKGCSLGDLCTNKRFQKIQNAPCEVFKTSWKGFGIRALSDFASGTFIMEYVGEVLDPRQFRKRAKQYSNDDVQHFYFMALSKDFCVDATLKGNISRFINHSCDPNSETQKWTVNGELRVGFFTRRTVAAGEELTFDYKYERYGQQAQRCYCNSYNCRGWLGGEPGNDQEPVEELEEWSSSEEEEVEDVEVDRGEEKVEAVKEEKKKEKHKKEKELKKRRKKNAGKIKNFEAEEFEEEIERFQNTGIRNKMQAIGLNRLMIRASGLSTKTKLANLLLCADKPCKRLFIDYQGPQILKSWMSELNWSHPELDLKLLIETILSELSFPHKTMLKDSGLYKMVEKWSVATPHNDRDEEEEDKDAFVKKSNSPNNSRASSPRSSRPGSPRSSKANSPRRCGPCTPPPAPDVKGEEDMDIDEEDEESQVNIELPQLPNQTNIPELGLFRQRGFSPEPLPPGVDPEPLPPGVSPPGSPRPVQEEKEEQVEAAEETTDENKEEISEAKMLLKDESVSLATGGEVAQLTEQVVEEQEINNQIPQLETRGENVDEAPRGENVAEALAAQADVVQEASAEVDSEVLGGGVEPVGREEVPATEEEIREAKEIEGKVTEIQARAKELLKVWALLQEVFKIPKKERHKMRVEHEREADRSGHGEYRRLVGMVSNLAQLGRLQEEARSYAQGERVDLRIGRPAQQHQRYADARGFSDSRPPQRGERGYSGYGGRAQNSGPSARSHLPGYSNDRSRLGMAGSPLTRERRNLRLDDETGRLMLPHLNKEDRRMLFAAKIAEEERQKKSREALSAMHSQACRLLCLDPAVTPMFKKYPEFYFDSTSNQWIAMPPMAPTAPDWEPPLMARLPPEAYRPDDEPLPNPLDIYPPGICPIEPEPPQPVITPQVNVETFEDICAYYEEMYRLRREQSPDDEFGPVEKLERVDKDYRSPSPCPEFRRRDRSKDRAKAKGREGVRGPRTPSSSPERRIITRRSESLSPVPFKGPRTPPSPLRCIADIDWGLDDDRSPSPLPLSFGEERIITNVELSPGNYRSPSPVQWSPRPTPGLVGTKLPSFNPVTGLPDNPFFPIKPDSNPSPTPTPTSIPFLDSDPKHEVAFTSEAEPQPVAEPEPVEAPSHPGYYTSPAKQRGSQDSDTGRGKWRPVTGASDKPVVDTATVSIKAKTPVRGIYTATVTTERVEDIIVKLPSKWKMARDSEGRAYYYHSQSKAVQWEPPTEEQLAEEEEDEEAREEREEKIDMETASTDSEGEEDRSEDGDDTDTEDDSEEDETTEGTGEDETTEDGEIPDSDLSASEKKMLLRMRRRTKEERQLSRRQKKERDKERREGERQWLRERHKRHRAKGLVEEHIIPARITDKDKVDLMTFKEMRERLLHKDEIRQQQEREEREEEEADRKEKDRREKAKRAEEKRALDKARRESDAVKFQQLVDADPTQQQQTPVKTPTKHSKTKDTTTAAADTSSDVEKKYKDKFVKEISKTIVKILDPYRRKGVKGYISTTEDFKHLAKKLTYSIMQKEMKQCKSIEELKASEKVKKKAAEYVQKYMKRYESEYQRSPGQPQ